MYSPYDVCCMNNTGHTGKMKKTCAMIAFTLSSYCKRVHSGICLTARIQYEQAASYIQLLADNGTKGLPKTIAEHLRDGIWELRPGNNRIVFFFFNDDGSYVLLHQFRKKTQKTPLQEKKLSVSGKITFLKRKDNGHDLGRL